MTIKSEFSYSLLIDWTDQGSVFLINHCSATRQHVRVLKKIFHTYIWKNKMKNITICILFFLIGANLFAGEKIPKRFFGTYLPEKYIDILIKDKIHRKALLSNENKYYDVIVITLYKNKETIFSNNGFHDQFTIDLKDFEHNWYHINSNDSKAITDTIDNKYIKISNNTNYTDEVKKFITNHIFGKKIYKNDSMELQVLEDGNILLNKKEYRLNLDFMSRIKEFDEFYSIKNKERKCIAIELIKEKIIIYNVKEKKLPNGHYDIEKLYELE